MSVYYVRDVTESDGFCMYTDQYHPALGGYWAPNESVWMVPGTFD